MWYLLVRAIISAVLIVAISEISRRSTLLGGLLASLPIVSILAFIWLYVDERDTQKVADLSWSVFWLVLPSLSLFIVLPVLLKRMPFALSLAAGIVIMLACYGLMLLVLRQLGVEMK